MSLLIRGARLRRLDGFYDILIEDGRIVELSTSIKRSADEKIDAGGRLLTPSFTDMHFHLDSALTLGDPRYNESGTLIEGIEIWAEKKRGITVDDVKKRAIKAVKMMVSYGTTRLRTHADITEPKLSTLKGLLEVKKEMKDIIDMQITAFPQDGILTERGNVELLEKAVEMGADNVGIIPHYELTREDGVKSISVAFDIAQKYGKDVDGHVDETDDEQSRFLEVVAAEAIKRGYERRVTAGHATAMHSYNDAYAYKLYRILRRAGVTIIANPLINIHLQGRFDTYPKRRGMTRIKELLKHGVNVALGHDCIRDPWYPLGRGDMMQALFMAVHVGHLMGYQELKDSLDLITINAAKALRIEHEYGVETGKRADLVLLDARDELEALALQRPPLLVIKNGRIVVRRSGSEAELVIGGRKEKLDYV
ncbi:MAG TPA: cytosine deaminase [Candidatus Caldiarchaeum subterraneum]|uniref:Cytosine deaminase n=1 Tax=Caldiarchaeum subterraneum TaxID=311458 RepID=A0A833ECE7_CALS0|nr:cytosine deaminase [Aigarchaeota archaeon]HIQ30184.1 cytosine deaminase [Candidatus Caldarchaeum subterraneum]